MNRNLSAGLYASLTTGVGTLLFVIPMPVVNILALIVIMLPLWVINDFGFINLGYVNNGFFIPNVLGYTIAGGFFWLLCFFVMRLSWPRR